MNLRKGFSHQFKSECQISNSLMKKFKYRKMLLRVAVCCYFFFVQHMADTIHTTDQTGKNFYHVTQFHPITVNHINFLMNKFKYLDLPQYLFINMTSYCCKQKFLYRFFIINMTRNIRQVWQKYKWYWLKW
jgi:hypothetical protein